MAYTSNMHHMERHVILLIFHDISLLTSRNMLAFFNTAKLLPKMKNEINEVAQCVVYAFFMQQERLDNG